MRCDIGPEGVMKGEINIISKNPNWYKDYETIERKGIGHPDSIADALASSISRNYSKYTTQYCDDMVLHHQIDKLMIIGGKTEVTWGGGKFVEKIKIIVAGRATYTYLENNIPVDDIIRDSIKVFFNNMFQLVSFENDIIVENHLTEYAGPGTIKQSKGAIANMFNPISKNAVRGYEDVIANDTSYCIAYAPYSQLELAVLNIEKHLNSKQTKKDYPWLGCDIKIMAVRNSNKIGVTMCVPQIAKYVHSLEEYLDNLKTVANMVSAITKEFLQKNRVHIAINTKDNYKKNNVYLTVSGSSLSGDIGVVGRGNRTNGLITSNRPMSMEGTNGKNPRYYSGFVYANLTKKIVNRLYKKFQKPCSVEIVSQNGGLLLDPWHTRVVIDVNNITEVKEIVKEEIAKTLDITKEFIEKGAVNY